MDKKILVSLGLIILVSGPSGTGKSTLLKRLIKRLNKKYERVWFSISCTTRLPRKGEVNGRDYYFLSRYSFEKEISEGNFAEWAEVHGNFYGTLWSEINDANDGQIVVVDVDVQGAQSIRKGLAARSMSHLLCDIFIYPPSQEALKKRLLKRGDTEEKDVVKRLKNANKEMSRMGEYMHRLENRILRKTFRVLRLIISRHILSVSQ